ncbi:polyprenyl synthetase family protein [Halobacteriovorax sp. GB3]|uniref:polyprenyl synthetase family protein n=1 Tax=Halobacteriovorax sp. GB3 TaxID=2719615 RepID=UPI0023625696|nr:polyprenyl synthetase family protein [Halobacteriovorax sp. GB3]MDD0852941.1 polyprenyl synthetase family protein [Halobacteriovorax sp. GB3]
MFQDFLASIPESVLDEVQDLNLDIESENCNKAIEELLQQSVLVGGKRLRPLLTYLMGNLFQVSASELSPFAKAIELVHAASLAHDDVVDDASTRRGEPSINALASNQKAVLAGDYLLADVIYTLAHKGDLTIVQNMSLVIQALAEGEWIQLDASGSKKYTRELIKTIAMKKTASVMGWCCWVGAYKAQKGSELERDAKTFGEKVGVAFQLMDDTLDFSKDSKKDSLLDVQNGIINSVLFEWLESHPEAKAKFEAGESMAQVFDSSDIAESCTIVENRALDLLREARELLDSMKEKLDLDEAGSAHYEQAKLPLLKILEYLAKRKF